MCCLVPLTDFRLLARYRQRPRAADDGTGVASTTSHSASRHIPGNRDVQSGNVIRTVGAALGLVAAAGLAVANLITKHLGTRVDALTATTWQYVLGAVPLVAWSLIVEDWAAISWSVRFVTALLFLGVIGSAGASYVWYRLVQRTELIRLNALTLLTPFFSVVLALGLYGEPFSGEAALGSGLILAAVTGVAWRGDQCRAQSSR